MAKNRGNVRDNYERPACERKKETYEGWRAFGPFVWAALRLAPGDIGNQNGELAFARVRTARKSSDGRAVILFAEQASSRSLPEVPPRRQNVVRERPWRGKSRMIGCACTIYFRMAHTCRVRGSRSRHSLVRFRCFLVSEAMLRLASCIYAYADPHHRVKLCRAERWPDGGVVGHRLENAISTSQSRPSSSSPRYLELQIHNNEGACEGAAANVIGRSRVPPCGTKQEASCHRCVRGQPAIGLAGQAAPRALASASWSTSKLSA
jgi:hypothetical protein